MVNSTNVWHKRLGHPSLQVLLLLPRSLGVIDEKNKDDVCETCHAKQTRSNFHISFNRAKCVFELIHCDIWGPY